MTTQKLSSEKLFDAKLLKTTDIRIAELRNNAGIVGAAVLGM